MKVFVGMQEEEEEEEEKEEEEKRQVDSYYTQYLDFDWLQVYIILPCK